MGYRRRPAVRKQGGQPAAASGAGPREMPDLRSSTTALFHYSMLHSGVCIDDTSWHADEQETLSLPISSRRHRLLARRPAAGGDVLRARAMVSRTVRRAAVRNAQEDREPPQQALNAAGTCRRADVPEISQLLCARSGYGWVAMVGISAREVESTGAPRRA